MPIEPRFFTAVLHFAKIGTNVLFFSKKDWYSGKRLCMMGIQTFVLFWRRDDGRDYDLSGHRDLRFFDLVL